MPLTHQILIIDQSGVQQALDFDYRHHNCKSLYNDVRSEIKKAFTEKIELISKLFPETEIKFNINLEQEKKDETSETLASFDSDRSGAGVYVFHVYYSTIRQIANATLTPNQNAVLHSFCDTIMHELIHAADLSVLKEANTIHENSYKLYGGNYNQLLKDINGPNYEWNVQWALLSFFQIFRNEGIAMLGQHLLDNKPNLVEDKPTEKVMHRFKENMNQVFRLCSGLKFYNSLESTNAHLIIRELSLEAYQYGDVVLLEMLKTIYPEHKLIIEKANSVISGVSNNIIDKTVALSVIKLGMQMDLSEYLQAIFNNEILNSDEPLSKQQLLECCAIIQNDAQNDTLSQFSKNIGICGYNRNCELFIETIRAVIGSKMSVDEITESYQSFLKKEYPEDIVCSIRKMTDHLFPRALNENNEVALWSLTYLLDDQDLIHDELSVLGWQDDWMVLDAACRITSN